VKNSTEFQAIIGYRFKDQTLIEKALTHNSFVKEKELSRLNGNERLEFLGDAFFDAIIGEALYISFPEVEEGFLTKVRASIVCEKSLLKEGEKLQIGQYLKIGRGEEKSGGRARASIIADAMEAVIGAVYLDGGYEAAKGHVLRTFGEALENALEGKFDNADYKSELQEILQGKGILDIQYHLEKEDGPDHSKTFFVSVKVDGKKLGCGSGGSKKEAEQRAAKDGIERGLHVF